MHSAGIAYDGDIDSPFVQHRRNALDDSNNLWAKTPLHSVCSEHASMVSRVAPNILRVYKTAV